MPDSNSKLRLPRITGVVLRAFSLYSLQPTINVEMNKEVFCLAGANGLGKSTFLLAMNFGLTGIVGDPERKFDSVEEYYRHSLRFSSSFFSGRIEERDREAAEVVVRFKVGAFRYSITRGMFEPEELRQLEIIEERTQQDVVLYDGKLDSNGQRHDKYKEHLCSHIGLDSFEQYVFIQHFVLTFDERRHTLFWNPKTLGTALYLAFGLNPAEANRADSLRRSEERAGSLARNFSWQATEVRKRINDIHAKVAETGATSEDIQALEEQHQKLLEDLDTGYSDFNRTSNELKDATLKITELSSRELSLRDMYALEFSKRLRRGAAVSRHPLVVNSLEDNSCGLCGAQGEAVTRALEAISDGPVACPLCGSSLSPTNESREDISGLQQLDEDLARIKEEIRDTLMAADRIKNNIQSAKDAIAKTQATLDQFERANGAVLSELKASRVIPGGINAVLQSYRSQLEEFVGRKSEEYDKRDKFRKELLSLQRELEKRYAEAEEIFVPSFTELAQLFLGLDLRIDLVTGATPGVTLRVEIKGSARREEYQLSESQRFFLDIALRMALSKYMCSEDSKGSLLLDTPEGSLDIAYEKRAGDMLSRFVESGHRVVMTANINTSKLLLALAKNCKAEKMTLCRMTSWTELSDVQVAEEGLFNEAFSQIELALKNSNATKAD